MLISLKKKSKQPQNIRPTTSTSTFLNSCMRWRSRFLSVFQPTFSTTTEFFTLCFGIVSSVYGRWRWSQCFSKTIWCLSRVGSPSLWNLCGGLSTFPAWKFRINDIRVFYHVCFFGFESDRSMPNSRMKQIVWSWTAIDGRLNSVGMLALSDQKEVKNLTVGFVLEGNLRGNESLFRAANFESIKQI